MQTTSCTNVFSSLRIEEYSDAEPCLQYDTICITQGRNEVVNLLIAEAVPGKFVQGYSVFWANGRSSMQQPSLVNGYFRSATDAMLFTLGFMQQYLTYFLPETAEAIKQKIKVLSQSTLF